MSCSEKNAKLINGQADGQTDRQLYIYRALHRTGVQEILPNNRSLETFKP